MSEENIVEKAKQKPNKKSKKRFFIVIAVAFIAFIVAYVMFRGTYLETLEIGEKYITAFWQNIKYAAITVIINFGIIYFMFYITNIRIRNGLKEFLTKKIKKCHNGINFIYYSNNSKRSDFKLYYGKTIIMF